MTSSAFSPGGASLVPGGPRLALVSTPRSGNTWLRHLLGQVFAADELAVHDPSEVPWNALPAACVLQMHQHHTPALEAQLACHGFRVVVLARHPLDVLLSILHFATHDGATARWLPGEGGDEAPVHGAMPGSPAFVAYAQGSRAQALLSVSPAWWDAPGSLGVRYEDLVAQPALELERLIAAVGLPARVPPGRAVADTGLADLRRRGPGRHHFWQGRPGLWRRLLVSADASAIAAVHAGVFARLGYVCDPDSTLNRAQADACWIDLNRAELTEKLWHYPATRHELEQAQAHLAAAREQLRRLTDAGERLQARCRAAECLLEGAATVEAARARRLLSAGRQELAAAQQASRDCLARLPRQPRWWRLARTVARAARRWLRRPV
jgi:hypothetical protein